MAGYVLGAYADARSAYRLVIRKCDEIHDVKRSVRGKRMHLFTGMLNHPARIVGDASPYYLEQTPRAQNGSRKVKCRQVVRHPVGHVVCYTDCPYTPIKLSCRMHAGEPHRHRVDWSKTDYPLLELDVRQEHVGLRQHNRTAAGETSKHRANVELATGRRDSDEACRRSWQAKPVGGCSEAVRVLIDPNDQTAFAGHLLERGQALTAPTPNVYHTAQGPMASKMGREEGIQPLRFVC